MKRKTTEQPLQHELLLLTDAFAEHTCISAFMLSALTAVMSVDDAQQPEVVAGAKLCADALQTRTRELKLQLDHACERYCAERDKADSGNR